MQPGINTGVISINIYGYRGDGPASVLSYCATEGYIHLCEANLYTHIYTLN